MSKKKLEEAIFVKNSLYLIVTSSLKLWLQKELSHLSTRKGQGFVISRPNIRSLYSTLESWEAILSASKDSKGRGEGKVVQIKTTMSNTKRRQFFNKHDSLYKFPSPKCSPRAWYILGLDLVWLLLPLCIKFALMHKLLFIISLHLNSFWYFQLQRPVQFLQQVVPLLQWGSIQICPKTNLTTKKRKGMMSV